MQYEKSEHSFWKRINYFFLLPNWVFFIFPIVDYKTFVRNYYDVAAVDNYRKGIHWMIRGLLHLFAYRIIYYYLVPDPTKIHTLLSLIQYLVTSYALILRLSGIFHFSAGVLCLFGYNLPETFNNYFLASGFSDLWRRINIYWKDFVMKVIYFPVYFSFKRKNNLAVFATVMIIFTANWFLHAYQWFWIRGTFLIKWTDVLFWAIFGVLVGLNSVYQKNRKRKKETTEGFNIKTSGVKTMQIMAMFGFMCLLWSFWISDTIENWIFLFSKIDQPSVLQLLVVIVLSLTIWCLGVVAFYITHKNSEKLSDNNQTSSNQIWTLTALLGVFVSFGYPPINNKLKEQMSFDIEPIMMTKLNAFDEEQLFKGYYEDLMVGNNFSSRMWEVEKDKEERITKEMKPDDWSNLWRSGILKKEGGFINGRLLPDTQIIFKNQIFTTNQYGMRDRNYPLEKDKYSLRMAMLGGSIELGSGVGDDETFENLLEDKLNEEDLWPYFKKIEILNFAIAGLHYPKQVGIAEERVKPFKPDILIYPFHLREEGKALKSFSELFTDPSTLKNHPELLKYISLANITAETSRQEAIRNLEPYKRELFIWALERMGQFCSEQDIIPIWLYVPTRMVRSQQIEFEYLSEIAQSQGFFILDIRSAFEGYENKELRVAKWDNHPSALGHQLIANALFEEMRNNKALNDAINSRK
jgi:D-alanyl-lipoteichoic acid acyltransferase DltB (MBOAT superfamily)